MLAPRFSANPSASSAVVESEAEAFDVLTTKMAKRWLSPGKLLELCDEDGSGEMEYEEYVRVLRELRLRVPERIARTVFDSIDEDHSGASRGRGSGRDWTAGYTILAHPVVWGHGVWWSASKPGQCSVRLSPPRHVP